MLFNKFCKIFCFSIVLLVSLQSCYLFCLFKADPILEETVEKFLEKEVMHMNEKN